MKDLFTIDELKTGLRKIAAKMDACREELNTLDGQLGDGDLGITMTAGFANVMEQIDTLPADPGAALLGCAQAFVRGRASSFGTLVATGLMAAGKAVKGREQVPLTAVPDMLREAVEKMALRGKSALGDKTVLDALEAARIAAEGAAGDGAKMLEAVAAAVDRALEEYKTKSCRQGRARIFAEKSATMYDPGMFAIQRMIDGLAGR
jgi:dihydroxyacetone kinase-like protein